MNDCFMFVFQMPLRSKSIKKYQVSNNGCNAGYGIYFPNKELKNIGKAFTIEPITNQRAVKLLKQKPSNLINIYMFVTNEAIYI